MRTNLTDHRNTDGKSPTSALLLRSPLDFIAEDHMRLRAMCAEMERMADAPILHPDDVCCLRDYLTQELPALLADEDDDLMPLVLERAEPDDEVPRLVDRLSGEHARIDALLAQVLAITANLELGGTVSAALREALSALASLTRRHVVLENAVLLPLARARLRKSDLDGLRNAMLTRRGLEGLFAD